MDLNWREKEVGKEKKSSRGGENGSNGSCEDRKWARERTVQGTDWAEAKNDWGLPQKMRKIMNV